MASGRPGPLLLFGVPLVIVLAGGFLAWKLVAGGGVAGGKAAPVAKHFDGGRAVKITADGWSGYSTFRDEPRLAAELAKSDIAIDYVDDKDHTLWDQDKRMEALASGKLDLAMTTIDAFLQHGAKHRVAGQYPGVIIWNIDESNGGDAIFVAKGKHNFDDVKPTDVACFTPGTPSEHLWDFASLSFAHLADLPTDYKDAKGQDITSAEDCWKKLQAGKVQVAVLWQPFTAIAERAGYTKVFATGGQAADVIIDIMVANREFARRESATIDTIGRAYFKVIDGYMKDRAAHARFITQDCGDDCGKDEKLGAAVLDGIEFLTLEKNVGLWWGISDPAKNKMPDRLARTGKLLALKHKIAAGDLPTPASVLDDSFLRRLAPTSVRPCEITGTCAEAGAPAPGAPLERQYDYATCRSAQDNLGAEVGTLKMPVITFGIGSSALDAKAKDTVTQIVDKLRSFPALCIKVYGHTSSDGAEPQNVKLSRDRANAIADFIKSFDMTVFPATRFDVRGFGSQQRILKDGHEDVDASRRTEFKLFNLPGH